jgi:CubicO group peptidase (beta-lactamase class C family)
MTVDPIRVGPPSAAGVDARGLLAVLDAFEGNPGIRPHGLVVLRDGMRIAQGWWAPFTAERRQLVYSVSKSFTSTAAGFARAEGLLDLDATVVSYFPELDADVTDPRSRRMTVRDLATMASGHATDTIDRVLAIDPANPVRAFLSIPPDHDPGTVFAYNQLCTYTLAAIVQRAAGVSLADYLRPRLFDPLGISDVSWIEYPAGQNLGFSGLHTTTDAVARLGELYRCGGRWGEARLLDAAWVEQATRRWIATPPVPGGPDWEQGYGFQFWMSQHGYRGDGAFGQFCVVVPERGLVVAITAETLDMQAVLTPIWEFLLPALAAPGDPAEDAALAARLAGLALPAPGTSGPATGGPDTPGPAAPRAARPVSGNAEVRELRLRHDDRWRLEITDAGGTLDVPFGLGEWLTNEADVPTAASGGWDSRGDLEVEVLFLETPHTLRVRISADGAARATWSTVPLHGVWPTSQHRRRTLLLD